MSNLPEVELVSIEELVGDRHNANLGTPRGLDIIEKSIQKTGNGRSGLLDKNRKIVAGNKYWEKVGELGFEEAIVIKSDGTRPIFHQRTDWDLDTDEMARMAAYYDNAAPYFDIEWDSSVIREDEADGLPLRDIWNDKELDKFAELPEEDEKPLEAEPVAPVRFRVVVSCTSTDEAQDAFYKLKEQGYNCELEIG